MQVFLKMSLFIIVSRYKNNKVYPKSETTQAFIDCWHCSIIRIKKIVFNILLQGYLIPSASRSRRTFHIWSVWNIINSQLSVMVYSFLDYSIFPFQNQSHCDQVLILSKTHRIGSCQEFLSTIQGILVAKYTNNQKVI